jgi:hypothetical protein
VEEGEPLRLFTADHFNDKYPNHSTYGAVPIIQAKSEGQREMLGLFWCNASDTWVDIIKREDHKRYAHFISEAGHL